MPDTEIPTATADLPAAAAEMLDLMIDALGTHVYSLEDGDHIPANCAHVAAIDRVSAALGLPPADIDTTPVWSFAATFTTRDGRPGSYASEVTGDDIDEAMREGRAELDARHPGATGIDGAVQLLHRREHG